jgi:hypothetical protein
LNIGWMSVWRWSFVFIIWEINVFSIFEPFDLLALRCR